MSQEDTIINRIVKEIHRLREQVVTSVLTDLLDREPTEEDVKLVQLFQPDYDSTVCFLAYNNMKLGVIKISHSNELGVIQLGVEEYKVEFTPFEKGEYLEPAIVNKKVTF